MALKGVGGRHIDQKLEIRLNFFRYAKKNRLTDGQRNRPKTDHSSQGWYSIAVLNFGDFSKCCK